MVTYDNTLKFSSVRILRDSVFKRYDGEESVPSDIFKKIVSMENFVKKCVTQKKSQKNPLTTLI